MCENVPLRVLLAVHGHEPGEWVTRACRLVSGWSPVTIRVLAVFEVPSPPFTSVVAPARRLYAAARNAWKEIEEERVKGAVERVLPALSGDVEVVREEASPGGLGDLIVEHALAWSADVVAVAAPRRMSLPWLWPGPVHERLLRCGVGAVLAIPAEPVSRQTGRPLAVSRALRLRVSPVTSPGV
ncbi:MAG: hypothetical protein ACRELZ_05805 [Candidatus Rokuibacteriota bacterium]